MFVISSHLKNQSLSNVCLLKGYLFYLKIFTIFQSLLQNKMNDRDEIILIAFSTFKSASSTIRNTWNYKTTLVLCSQMIKIGLWSEGEI